MGKGRVGEQQPDSPGPCHFILEGWLVDVMLPRVVGVPADATPLVAVRVYLQQVDNFGAQFVHFAV